MKKIDNQRAVEILRIKGVLVAFIFLVLLKETLKGYLQTFYAILL